MIGVTGLLMLSKDSSVTRTGHAGVGAILSSWAGTSRPRADHCTSRGRCLSLERPVNLLFSCLVKYGGETTKEKTHSFNR